MVYGQDVLIKMVTIWFASPTNINIFQYSVIWRQKPVHSLLLLPVDIIVGLGPRSQKGQSMYIAHWFIIILTRLNALSNVFSYIRINEVSSQHQGLLRLSGCSMKGPYKYNAYISYMVTSMLLFVTYVIVTYRFHPSPHQPSPPFLFPIPKRHHAV